MLPVIALIGRPNVGKSTLFNKLTRRRDAIVDDQPGVTRDILFGKGNISNRSFLVIDTGGIDDESSLFAAEIKQQVLSVVDEADFIFFMVDAKEGLVPQDREVANLLRQSDCSVHLMVNKAEGLDAEMAAAEFQELGLGEPVPLSALRGDGVKDIIESLLPEVQNDEASDDDVPRFALVGRPNVGKSTLTNKLVGSYRVIVSDMPGTTRDSVRIPLQHHEKEYLLIDTAGVRRKSRVDETLEKFSVIKTLQAIEDSHVVFLVLDASSEIGAQDATIAGMIQNLGKSIVILVNKWDRLEARQKKKIKNELDLKLPFLSHAEVVFISALHGSNLKLVLPAGDRAFASAMVSLTTSSLNRVLSDAVSKTAPPMRHQRPTRLKFAHQAGKNPPVIVVHGNQAEHLPDSYRRYLSKYFAERYKLVGTTIKIIPRNSQNPYEQRTKKSKPGTGKFGDKAQKSKKQIGRRR